MVSINCQWFLRKMNKPSLSKYLEQLSVPTEGLPNNVATIIDAVSIGQEIKGAQKTFGNIAKLTFNDGRSNNNETNRCGI